MKTHNFLITPEEIHEALSGHEVLFGKLMDTYREAIIKTLTNRGVSLNDTDDCIQHAFVQLWKHKARIGATPKNVFVWLCTVAINKSRDIQEKMRRTQLISDTADLEKLMEPIEEDFGLDEDVVKAVRTALSNIPKPYQTVLRLQMKGLSYKDIADSMQCKIGTVMSRRTRAVGLMRKECRKKVLLLIR